ncbi:MAG: hypothetical protein CBC03_09195 [Pseudoalteromonas sp. TMED43]|nr:MAG: hypothetical protein CBC03_09195 [Pseudoalteromonas sp. TMED43]|tara:strand:- start:1347 stop:1790 length:444 start_codon:yes stop_codon:yes gene_type:complete
MAEQRGGMRRPQNPAPVSGPGRLSQRTDGGPQQVQAEMSGMPYGENQEFEAIQASAPMKATPAARAPKGAAPKSPASLFSPTQRPDEPVTSGASFGPGDTPRQAGFQDDYDSDMEKLLQYLPDLEAALDFENTPKTFRYLVNYLRNA